MSSNPFGRKADGAFGNSRRRFVQGLAAGGAVAGFGLWPKALWAMKSPGQLTVLAGTEFDLAIGETPVNFTGRTRPAISRAEDDRGRRRWPVRAPGDRR
jgi:hypothetical protein